MLNFQKERSYLLLNTSPFSNFSRFDLTYLKCLSTFAFQVNKIQTELQDTISQLKSLQDVLQTSQKRVQEKEKKVEELDKMLNESMEELQQKDKNLKEKESKVVELDKALKERQWELKQKAAQVRTRNRFRNHRGMSIHSLQNRLCIDIYFYVLQASAKAGGKHEASAERESRATGLGIEKIASNASCVARAPRSPPLCACSAVQCNPNYLNPQFLKPLGSSNQNSLPLDWLHCNVTHDFSNHFGFPLKV